MMKEKGSTKGPNRMYFETGQGSALSSRGAPRRRSGDDRGALLRPRAALQAVPGQHGRRLHRPRVPRGRPADHARRARGSLHGQAARPADGLRRVLHLSRADEPGRAREPQGPARRRRLHVPDVAAGRRRHHAQLPVDELSTTSRRCAACSASARRPSSTRGSTSAASGAATVRARRSATSPPSGSTSRA